LFSLILIKLKIAVKNILFIICSEAKEQTGRKYVHLKYTGTGEICSMTDEQARNVLYGQKKLGTSAL
jgi:hypothetical protein